MTRPIAATITRDRNGQALVVLDSEPFNGLEIRPVELRAMAQHLTALADMAHKLPMGGKGFKPTVVQFGRDENPSAPDLSADHIACLEMLDLVKGLLVKDRQRFIGTPCVRAELSAFVAKLFAGSNLSGMDEVSFAKLALFAAENKGLNHVI